jgi:hypothetical protein
MGGMGGTIYGTGGAKDAGRPDTPGEISDSRPLETGESPDTRQLETGESPDTLTSEAGAVEPKDALPGGPEIL